MISISRRRARAAAGVQRSQAESSWVRGGGSLEIYFLTIVLCSAKGCVPATEPCSGGILHPVTTASASPASAQSLGDNNAGVTVTNLRPRVSHTLK